MQRVQTGRTLQVCISPAYHGVSYRSPRTQELSGIDIDLSAALAKDLGVKLRYVDSNYAKLVDDLNQNRCDIAMFAIGITAERQKHLRFSTPYLQSDVYGVTTKANRVIKSWADIDKPGIRVAVPARTFIEPVMAAWLKQAELVVLQAPQSREQELESGRVDVFMADYPYSRHWLATADWARLVSPPAPFHLMPYAYAVKPGDEAWLTRINAFVAKVKKDGRLESYAKQHGLSEILLRN